jgi:sortase A
MAVSAGMHSWSLHASSAGIQALESAREQPPDTTTWSAQRIAAYRAALAANEAPFALLRIPALHLVVPIFEGTSEWALNRGAGRIAGTATESNLGIAGHRDGFFRALRNIRVGDVLLLESTSAVGRYRVTQLKIVEPTDTSVLQATPMPTVTLVTCYPFYYIGPAPRRFIVHAARVESLETADQAANVEQRGQAHEQHAGGADQR